MIISSEKFINKMFASYARKSLLGGLCIAIATFVYLTNPGIIGAVLFSFGLLAVLESDAYLYTGIVGFIGKPHNIKVFFHVLFFLLAIYIANVAACQIMGFFGCISLPQEAIDLANEITVNRINTSWGILLIKSMSCGFIMTMAVLGYKRGNYLPLLFGIPTFILCGFPHSVADAVYFAIYQYSDNPHPTHLLFLEFVGNGIGALIWRFTNITFWFNKPEEIKKEMLMD